MPSIPNQPSQPPKNVIKATSSAGRFYRGHRSYTLKGRSEWHTGTQKIEQDLAKDSQRVNAARDRVARQAQQSSANREMYKSLRIANRQANLPKARGGVVGLMIQAAAEDLFNRPVADGTLDAARKRGDLAKLRIRK